MDVFVLPLDTPSRTSTSSFPLPLCRSCSGIYTRVILFRVTNSLSPELRADSVIAERPYCCLAAGKNRNSLVFSLPLVISPDDISWQSFLPETLLHIYRSSMRFIPLFWLPGYQFALLPAFLNLLYAMLHSLAAWYPSSKVSCEVVLENVITISPLCLHLVFLYLHEFVLSLFNIRNKNSKAKFLSVFEIVKTHQKKITRMMWQDHVGVSSRIPIFCVRTERE